MTSAPGIVFAGLFGWIILTITLTWLLAAAYPLLRLATNRFSALMASSLTLVYALLAPLTAAIASAILAAPELSFFLVSEHCHGEHCSPHHLQIATTAQGFVSAGLAISLLVCVIAWMLQQLFYNQRQLRMLDRVTRQQPLSYQVIDSEQHIAWCAGLWHPKVFISTGLLQTMSEDQLQSVLIHEFTHAYRRDNLRKWLLHWLTILWPGTLKQRVREDFNNYNERVCDLAAAQADNRDNAFAALITRLSGNHPLADNTAPATMASARLSALKRDKARLSHTSRPSTIDIFLFAPVAGGLWLALLSASVYFGHPLLEWLSR